jgi:predicted ATPase
MAYPNAAIYQLDNGEPSLIAYCETKKYRGIRNFLLGTGEMQTSSKCRHPVE